MCQPNRADMLRHVEALFGGEYDGALTGLVELIWGDFSQSEFFGTNQLEELADRAAALNAREGTNVYIGAALRKPGTTVRAKDEHFLSAPFLWIDIDKGDVGEATAKARDLNVRPNLVTVTGRTPNVRAHFYWRLFEACMDADTLRQTNAALVAAFGGDASCTNPSRIMRLAGSIAWPTKAGRVVEQVELHIPKDGRKHTFWPSELIQVAGVAAPVEKPQTVEPVKDSAPSLSSIGTTDASALLKDIQAGNNWHTNTLRFVAHYVNAGLSDSEILAFAPVITLTGYTVEQTRRDMERMLKSAREKWDIPQPGPRAAPQEKTGLELHWEDGSGAAMLPQRRWMAGTFTLRRFVSLLVALPGMGKSTLAMALAIASATGRGELIGEDIHEPANAWLFNAEDDQDELRRRLTACMQHWAVKPDDIRGRLALNSGADRSWLVARSTKDGQTLRMPDADAIISRAKEANIGLLIVDPFLETHGCAENDNVAIKDVAAIWRDIARKSDMSVVIIHHTGKPREAEADAWAGSLSAVRGASSLVGVCRVVRTLFGMTRKDADEYGVTQPDRVKWVRLDDAKSNLSLISGEPRWLEKRSIDLPNGDAVGVLVPGAPGNKQRAVLRGPEIRAALLDAIGASWKAGDPLSDKRRAHARYAPQVVSQNLHIVQRDVELVLEDMLVEGVVFRALFDPKRKLYGLTLRDL